MREYLVTFVGEDEGEFEAVEIRAKSALAALKQFKNLGFGRSRDVLSVEETALCDLCKQGDVH